MIQRQKEHPEYQSGKALNHLNFIQNDVIEYVEELQFGCIEMYFPFL